MHLWKIGTSTLTKERVGLNSCGRGLTGGASRILLLGDQIKI